MTGSRPHQQEPQQWVDPVMMMRMMRAVVMVAHKLALLIFTTRYGRNCKSEFKVHASVCTSCQICHSIARNAFIKRSIR